MPTPLHQSLHFSVVVGTDFGPHSYSALGRAPELANLGASDARLRHSIRICLA